MICLTLDLDWAHDAVLEDTLDLLGDRPATLFATHPTPLLRRDLPHLEIGLHPNFNPLLQGESSRPAEQVLLDLMAHYPGARGVRSHSLVTSTRLVELFGRHGLQYEANTFLPYARHLHPTRHWNGLVQIPFNWEDDLHAGYGRDFGTSGLDLAGGLNILDLHPIHIFLNTDTMARYEAARPHFQDPATLKTLRNRGPRPGVRDFFKAILSPAHAPHLRPLAEVVSQVPPATAPSERSDA